MKNTFYTIKNKWQNLFHNNKKCELNTFNNRDSYSGWKWTLYHPAVRTTRSEQRFGSFNI